MNFLIFFYSNCIFASNMLKNKLKDNDSSLELESSSDTTISNNPDTIKKSRLCHSDYMKDSGSNTKISYCKKTLLPEIKDLDIRNVKTSSSEESQKQTPFISFLSNNDSYDEMLEKNISKSLKVCDLESNSSEENPKVLLDRNIQYIFHTPNHNKFNMYRRKPHTFYWIQQYSSSLQWTTIHFLKSTSFYQHKATVREYVMPIKFYTHLDYVFSKMQAVQPFNGPMGCLLIILMHSYQRIRIMFIDFDPKILESTTATPILIQGRSILENKHFFSDLMPHECIVLIVFLKYIIYSFIDIYINEHRKNCIWLCEYNTYRSVEMDNKSYCELIQSVIWNQIDDPFIKTNMYGLQILCELLRLRISILKFDFNNIETDKRFNISLKGKSADTFLQIMQSNDETLFLGLLRINNY
ncbi:hypothetical protein NUSPORA_02163 [Nucleospora cyclopteri]